jgi:hypothetical protein
MLHTKGEPLELSAPLARQFAAESCRADPASGESCAWYHGFWQYLRLLGMGTTPAGHSDLFRQAFAGAPASAQVLIAGGADYGMLAQAAAACSAAGVQAQFTMIDWCDTPLRLASWYAERESLALRTVRRDLLDAGEESRYDAVCTQALLGHFAPAARPQLLAGFCRALRPGGLFVTAQRLRPDAPDAPIRLGDVQVKSFTDEVCARARGIPGIDEGWLAIAARDYASRQMQWPVRSTEEMRNLLEAAGFRLSHVTRGPMASTSAREPLNLPTVAGSADYARVIAFKA